MPLKPWTTIENPFDLIVATAVHLGHYSPLKHVGTHGHADKGPSIVETTTDLPAQS